MDVTPFEALEAFRKSLQAEVGLGAILTPSVVKSVAPTIRIRPEGVSYRSQTQADRDPNRWALRLAIWVEAGNEGAGLGLKASLDASFALSEFFSQGVRALTQRTDGGTLQAVPGVFFAGEIREDSVFYGSDSVDGLYQFSASYGAVLFGGSEQAPPQPRGPAWLYLASIGEPSGPVLLAGSFVRIEALDGLTAFPSWARENELWYCKNDLALAPNDRARIVHLRSFGPARAFRRVFSRLKTDASAPGRDSTMYLRSSGLPTGSGSISGVAEDLSALEELQDRFMPQVLFGSNPKRIEVVDKRVHFVFGNLEDFLAGVGALEWTPAILRELELSDDTKSTGAFRINYEVTEAGRPARLRLAQEGL